jgi:hypothetical protein
MSDEFPAATWDQKVQAELVFGMDPVMPLDRKGAADLMDYRRPKRAVERNEEAEETSQPDTCCGKPCAGRPCSLTTPATCDEAEPCYVDTFDWSVPATQSFLLDVCDQIDSSKFVTFDRDPQCTHDPCGVVRTTCIIKELVGWLNRNCTEAAQDDSECIGAESLLPSYGMQAAPDLACFSDPSRSPCLPIDKANRM